MEQTWRWFGPKDPVTLSDARQAGVEGIVTALHEVPAGQVWSVEAIQARQQVIAAAGLTWSVVESLEVTEAIKTRGPGWQQDVDNYIASLRNLATCGVKVVAYNLMPIFSWMRTHLHWQLPHGGYCVRFDATAFAAFDLFHLQRKGAQADWSEARQRAAHAWFAESSESERAELQATVLQGLPGGHKAFTLAEVQTLLERYSGIDKAAFRANAGAFLKAVCPVAEELGMRLCVHPDDPPRPLLGLPRIVSTADDLEWLGAQSPERANGITFCSGAFGVRADNDLVAMVKRFAPRIGFAHLRSTQRELGSDAAMESFYEAAHLEGDADLIGIVMELVKEERRRGEPLPFRPDHGQELLDDRRRGAMAGYPAIGRLRGLAEVRGVMRTVERLMPEEA
jgi:mannonate dehydratase